MNTSTAKNTSFSKVYFPNWDEIIHSYLSDLSRNDANKEFSDYVNVFFEKITEIKNIGFGNHIAQTMQIALTAEALQQNESSDEEINDFARNAFREFNQFNTIFELNSGDFISVDKEIERVLGLKPEVFRIPNLFGLNPEVPLYHPDDVAHVIRWAGIAYGVLSFPNFKIHSDTEYYKVNFRISTNLSSLPAIKEKKFLELEKKCFLKSDSSKENLRFPRYHLDKWYVYDADHFNYVKPKFVTSPEHSDAMNTLAYLMNAYILDLSPKYLLMLNSRRSFDRNKEIAFSINEAIKSNTGIENCFTENQIADTFAKTIRNKLYQICKKWDVFGSYEPIISEQQSLHYANKLGLLPVPNNVLSTIYKNISYE